MIWDIWIQAGIYGVIVFCSILAFSVVQRGFFWKFLKVRASFGRLILLQVRTPLQRYFSVGEVIDGFLVYKKQNKEEVRISVPNEGISYFRCMAIAWVVIDELTGAIDNPNFTVVTGFDQEKFSNLYKRALTRPTIGNTWEKTLFILMVLVIILVVADVYLSYRGYSGVTILLQKIPEWLTAAKGTVTQGAI